MFQVDTCYTQRISLVLRHFIIYLRAIYGFLFGNAHGIISVRPISFLRSYCGLLFLDLPVNFEFCYVYFLTDVVLQYVRSSTIVLRCVVLALNFSILRVLHRFLTFENCSSGNSRRFVLSAFGNTSGSTSRASSSLKNHVLRCDTLLTIYDISYLPSRTTKFYIHALSTIYFL